MQERIEPRDRSMPDGGFERIDPSTLALFEGTLGAVWGLALALVTLIQVASFGAVLTDSLLQGMLFGLGTTAVSLVVVPLLYFGIGAVLGLVHALVFNAVMRAMGRAERTAERVADGQNEAHAVAAPVTVIRTEVDETEPDTAYEPAEEYHTPTPRGARPAMTFGEKIPVSHEKSAENRPKRPRRRL